MPKAKFIKVPSRFKGVPAYKPNAEMLLEIAKSMPDSMLNMPGMEEWKKLKEESKK